MAQYEKRREKLTLEERILRIVEERGEITEPELKEELGLERPHGGYYRAINKLIENGQIGERAQIIYREERKRAARVFIRIKTLEDGIKEILRDLDFGMVKKKFGGKLKDIPSEAISVLISKLERILHNYSAMPIVVDFLRNAIEDKHFEHGKGELTHCFLELVERAVEEQNKPLLERIRKNIKWLRKITNKGKINKFLGAEIQLKLSDPRALNPLLDLLLSPDLDQQLYSYGKRAVNLFIDYVKLFPKEKERIKHVLYEVLREKKEKRTRETIAELILGEL